MSSYLCTTIETLSSPLPRGEAGEVLSRMEGFDFRGDYRDEDHLQDYEPTANESPKCDKRDLLVSSILRYSSGVIFRICVPLGVPGVLPIVFYCKPWWMCEVIKRTI